MPMSGKGVLMYCYNVSSIYVVIERMLVAAARLHCTIWEDDGFCEDAICSSGVGRH